MRILYVTTIGGTMNFFKSFIRQLLDEGHKVDIATNEEETPVADCYREWGCNVYQIETSRSPLNSGNIRAIKQLQTIVSKEEYDIVHCHTPVAAMCTRLACRKVRKTGTKVFYTAHGFHFYKGAPLKNWLLFYPVEKVCAYFTDVLITINKEDYALAQKKLKAKRVAYVPGVGIDLESFSQSTQTADKRKELNIPEDAKLLVSVGELNENKNHTTVICAVAQLENAYYIIAGEGGLRDQLQDLIDSLQISDRVRLLGYRNDVGELYKAADAFVFPSFREGLSVALMEAMASGLPCAVSEIRGNTDLIDTNGGVHFSPYSVEDCQSAIKQLLVSDLEGMCEYNAKKIFGFSQNTVLTAMRELYGV